MLTMTLTSLTPPVVDPAPTYETISNINSGKKLGHEAKLVLAKPVVVIMETMKKLLINGLLILSPVLL